MDAQVLGLLLNAGAIGLIAYLFLTDRLQTKKSADEQKAELVTQFEKRIKEGDIRWVDMRKDRDEWKKLALGTEKRLDVATPAVATAIGARIPSTMVATEAGE
jgi:hypothetical protein